MEVLTSKRDLAKVKRDLEAAGYKGEKIVVLTPTDIAVGQGAGGHHRRHAAASSA